MAKLQTEVRVEKLSDLVILKQNARYMTGAQYNRLKENIERDGALTSAPLVAPMEDGRLEILSGNHRVQAAIDAGIEQSEVIVITSPLTHEQKVAIQLSHNSITGQDDPNELQKLYEILSLDFKQYSGLTDDSFLMDELNLSGLSIGSPKYEEIKMLFLPEERQELDSVLSEITQKSKPMYAATLQDFNNLFEALTKSKRLLNIYNTAMAFRAIANLALKALNEMQQQSEHGDTEHDKPQ